MEDLEMKCFKMISNLGSARSSFMESITASKKGNFDLAKRLIEEGEKYRIEGHKVHFDLITEESNGFPVNINLLLLHAEDQLMNSDVIKVLSEEIFDLYKIILKESV